jgi:hypothetical protein
MQEMHRVSTCDPGRYFPLKPFIIIILLLFGFLPSPATADSMSCDGGIVSDGDPAVDLITKCGQPEWKDSHSEEVVDRIDRDVRRKTYINVEEWTYNFGPDRFLRIVTIRNGVITGIRTGGYGTVRDREAPGPACDDRIISIGDSKADILIKCGEPFYKSEHQEELKERIDKAGSRTIVVTVEEWTYNFGPQRFMRVITFRNGRVVDIRTGGYGR